MEELLQKILTSVNELNQNVNHIDDSIHHLEQRLARLEKMDSIEHRVTVNQIDLTDIKEIVSKMENFQQEEMVSISNFIKNNLKELKLNEEINNINKRLDAQLTKIAKNEETFLIRSRESK